MIEISYFLRMLSVVSVLVTGNAFAGGVEHTAVSDKAMLHRIVIAGFQFVPNELQVAVGDTIAWVNEDIVPHNIFIDETQEAISPDFKIGEEFKLVVKNVFDYSCGLHPSMKGKLSLINELGDSN